MRLFFAGAFIFLSVLLVVLFLPLSTPAWIKGIAMISVFLVATFIARKYIQFSFERDLTIEQEQQFDQIKNNLEP